ncbi:hypothetical protein V8E54_009735 [Elaphomyces granulatus]
MVPCISGTIVVLQLRYRDNRSQVPDGSCGYIYRCGNRLARDGKPNGAEVTWDEVTEKFSRARESYLQLALIAVITDENWQQAFDGDAPFTGNQTTRYLQCVAYSPTPVNTSPEHLAQTHLSTDEMNRRPAMGNGDIDALGVVDEGTGAQLLHSAAKDGRHQAVQFLIEKGVPIDAAEKFGRTLLYLAVFHRHLEVVRSKAAENGDIEILDLLKKGVLWNTQTKMERHPKTWRSATDITLRGVDLRSRTAEKFSKRSQKGLSQRHERPCSNARGITKSSTLNLAVQNEQIEVVYSMTARSPKYQRTSSGW